MCASRLALDPAGRRVVVATTSDPFTATGTVFLVLDGRSFGLMPEQGRRPSPQEQKQARAPYNPPGAPRERAEVPDDMLDEKAAVAAAYAEQRRQPVDVFQAVAA